MVDERDDWQAMAEDPRFRWQAGMLDAQGGRVVMVYPDIGRVMYLTDQRRCVSAMGGGLPDRTDRPTVGAVQGMAEAWCREHGYWISWILDNKATVEIEDELDTKFCCPCDDLATVAARALRWCWAQEVVDE
jgi:hypothetical protein